VSDEWWELVEVGDSGRRHLVISGEFWRGAVTLATPYPSLPLFVLSYPEFQQAMYSQTSTYERLLLDFRNLQRKVVAVLSCSRTEGSGGYCTVYHVGYFQRTQIECDWDASKKDFFCTEIDVMPLGWTARRAARHFWLEEEPLPSPYPAPRQGAAEIRGRLMTPGPPRFIGELVLPGAGPTRAVFTGFLEKTNGVFTVFVGGGTSAVFDAGFFAGAIAPDWSQVVEIVPKRLEIEGKLFFGWHPLRGEPVGPAPGAVVTELGTGQPGLRVLRAVVTDNGVRGVYLLGLEEAEKGLLVDGFLLATEAAYLSECRNFIVPENAVGVEFRQKPFVATLHLESSFLVEVDGSEPNSIRSADRMPKETQFTTAELRWLPGRGFQLVRALDGKEAPPQFVAVSDEGEIGSVAASPRGIEPH
jgi:hypothetical protein